MTKPNSNSESDTSTDTEATCEQEPNGGGHQNNANSVTDDEEFTGRLGVYRVSRNELDKPIEDRVHRQAGIYDFDKDEWLPETTADVAWRTPIKPSPESFDAIYTSFGTRVYPPENVPGPVVLEDGGPLEEGLRDRERFGPVNYDPDYTPENWVTVERPTAVNGTGIDLKGLRFYTNGEPIQVPISAPTAQEHYEEGDYSEDVLALLVEAGFETIEYPDELNTHDPNLDEQIETTTLETAIEAIANAYPSDRAVVEAILDIVDQDADFEDKHDPISVVRDLRNGVGTDADGVPGFDVRVVAKRTGGADTR